MCTIKLLEHEATNQSPATSVKVGTGQYNLADGGTMLGGVCAEGEEIQGVGNVNAHGAAYNLGSKAMKSSHKTQLE